MKLSEITKNCNIELSKEQAESLQKQLESFEPEFKNKKWVPENEENYYYIDSEGFILDAIFGQSFVDKFRLETDNCFKSSEEAKFRIKQIKVYNELKNFAHEYNDEIYWENTKNSKYSINYDAVDKKIIVSINVCIKGIGAIYFSTKELAEQAIKEIGEDRIKKYLFGVE